MADDVSDASMTDVQETGTSDPDGADASSSDAPWWRRWVVSALVLGGDRKSVV